MYFEDMYSLFQKKEELIDKLEEKNSNGKKKTELKSEKK